MEEYIDNGLRLGFVIEGQNKTAYLYRPKQAVEILKNPDTAKATPEFASLELAIKKVW